MADLRYARRRLALRIARTIWDEYGFGGYDMNAAVAVINQQLPMTYAEAEAETQALRRKREKPKPGPSLPAQLRKALGLPDDCTVHELLTEAIAVVNASREEHGA